ncbi:FAD binding domain-containing protein [Chthonobacter rhizosphaerae]|uniref:FAD binding domain-containing protein n=1 Tax=Chthonobacter rhizosphaerae TaxID=2735553 RepID=UPI0015EF11AE|nr:FAD binding domain-containing protein [Chthonobacter rhizosphaerae]
MPITVKTTATFAEAADLVAGNRAARFLGGGTLLMRDVNEGSVAFETLVRTTEPARAIRTAGSRIEIGAAVTIAQIQAERDLAFLHGAARLIGGPAVRAAGTVGGNLFAPSPYGDLATALLALDGVATLQQGASRREMPLGDLFAQRGRDLRGVVVSVSILRPESADAFRFRKVSRVKPKGAAVLTIAAHLPTSGGRIGKARVAYGAMAPTPIRARAVERALEGRSLDRDGVAAALAAAAEGTDPADDAIASAWYRREVAPVYLRRLLLNEPD